MLETADGRVRIRHGRPAGRTDPAAGCRRQGCVEPPRRLRRASAAIDSGRTWLMSPLLPSRMQTRESRNWLRRNCGDSPASRVREDFRFGRRPTHAEGDTLQGHKEPEPCQFASTAFWRPSQGSRVTSHRSSRAGVGCGNLRKPNRIVGSELAANQSWNARTPPRRLRNISRDLCASRSSTGF